MTALEQERHLLPKGTCKIEAHHIGHAVNHYRLLNDGTPYMRQIYYVSDIYAKPKGDSLLDCQRWAHRNGVAITA